MTYGLALIQYYYITRELIVRTNMEMKGNQFAQGFVWMQQKSAGNALVKINKTCYIN